MELFQFPMEEILKRLIVSDLKSIEKETGIPYDRMYKWTRGKSKPKSKDLDTLRDYFNGTFSKPKDPSSHSVDAVQELILELRDRLREKDDRLADKDKIIERTEESMFLWKEKALNYEKKISADVGDLATKRQSRPHVGRSGE